MKVAVIGAGLSGLTAALELRSNGCDVVVFDKGRGVGGRLATRRIGAATIDHGAQFFTVRSGELERDAASWQREGLVFEWSRGFGDEPDGYPRYAVNGGMTALAKHLALGIDVRTASMVFTVRANDTRWDVVLDDASTITVDAVVSTCPVPQTYSLLVSAGVSLPRELLAGDYERTLALLVVLDRPSTLRRPGARQQGHGVFSIVVDNALKGISRVPALTLHATADFSVTHWGDDRTHVHGLLMAAAAEFIGDATVVASQLKRWRFATPTSIWPEPCWSSGDGTMVVAGDAFAGPRIEGAYLSGRAAARHLLSL